MGEGDLAELAASVVARAVGGEEIEAYAVRSRETDVEVFGGEVESLSVAGEAGVGVRVVVDGRQGHAWAGSLEPDVVAATVAEARDNARFAAPDEWVGVPTSTEAAGRPAELDLWRDELATAGTDDKVQLALDLDAATRSSDPRVRAVEATGYGDVAGEYAVASSGGVVASGRRTFCSAYSVALAGEGPDTQTGYGFTVGRSVAELDLERVPRDASRRSTRLLGARPVPGRRLPVVLDPLVTAAFLGVVSSGLGAEAVLKGRSLFAGREGEAVAAPPVTLVDDPTDGAAPGAATHDGEGVPTRANVLVAGGVLRGFLHNVYTARRAGAATTGSAVRSFTTTPGVGVRALRLEAGTRTPEEIVGSIADGLYVQSVSGLHSGTNPVSGAFSVGAEGLLVREGALAEPVREITIASTIPRMLLDVVEVGSDVEFLAGATAGATVLVGEMSMSGA